MSQQQKKIQQKLLEFVKLYTRFEKHPGFSTTALGISLPTVSELVKLSNIEFISNKSFKVKWSLNSMPIMKQHNNNCTGIHTNNNNIMLLSTFMALADDLTTWALVLGDPKRGRAGKSICLRANNINLPTTTNNLNNDSSSIEMTCTVQKIGQSIGFVTANVYNSNSSSNNANNDNNNNNNELLCTISHIKHMPMDIISDFALSSIGWPIATFVTNTFYNDPVPIIIDNNDDKPLFNSLQFNNDDDIIATFQPTRAHASLGGPIHGGCQAILMELVAKKYIKETYGSGNNNNNESQKLPFYLDSITIDYMGAPKGGKVQFNIIDQSSQKDIQNRNGILLRVQLIRSNDMLTCSEGTLHFLPVSDLKKSYNLNNTMSNAFHHSSL